MKPLLASSLFLLCLSACVSPDSRIRVVFDKDGVVSAIEREL